MGCFIRINVDRQDKTEELAQILEQEKLQKLLEHKDNLKTKSQLNAYWHKNSEEMEEKLGEFFTANSKDTGHTFNAILHHKRKVKKE